MREILHVPGRLVLAGAFAVAVAVAPAVAVLAGGAPGVSVTADPPNPNPGCSVNSSNGSNSVVCTPTMAAPNTFLPSEQGLTSQNSGRH